MGSSGSFRAEHKDEHQLRFLQGPSGGRSVARVCPDLDGVRSALTPHGFVESRTLGELGDAVSWNFQKNDLGVVVGPHDFFASPGGNQCIQTVCAIGRVSE